MCAVTDWLMIGITTVYVVATIIICIWNIKSVKASKDQISISLDQFEESKRLQAMPFLQVEVPIRTDTPLFEIELPFNSKAEAEYIYSILVIKNVGNGTATNISYSWETAENNASDTFPISAISTSDRYVFQLTFSCGGNEKGNNTEKILWEYRDLLGNTYEQKVLLSFEQGELVFCENDTPHYMGIVKYCIKNNR